MFGATNSERAYFAPFLAFFVVFGLGGLVQKLFDGTDLWMISEPKYWVFPLQIIVCSVLLIRYWRWYEMKVPQGTVVAVAIGVVALLIWIAPQEWFGQPRRLEGFDPNFFGTSGWAHSLNVGLRFVRLVIVVPLIEEIFWRGFLLRYLIREDFTSVPMGTFTWKSFAIVTTGFVLEHSGADWAAAALTGVLYNLVAYRTRSLSACVLTHAVTNALLGWYVLHTGQWGFW
jgi:uncharacterized protein